jgi:MFS family permease
MTKKNIQKTTLLLASMMTMMAGAVVAPSLPQINTIFSLTPHANILTRLIITLPALFIAFFSPIFGKISDMHGRKKILLVALILYSLSGVTGYFFNNLYLILVGRAFLGIAVAGIMTIVVTLIGDYYVGKERSQFLGLQGSFMGIGGVVFISLAGWLADFGWHVPFLIYLFGFLVFPLVIVYLDEPEQFTHKKQTTTVLANIDYPRTLVTIIYILIFCGIIIFYMIPVQIPYLLKSISGVSNTQVGLAIASQSLTGALVAMNYRRIKSNFSFCNLYKITFTIIAIGYLIIGTGSTFTHIILGLIVSGMGIGLLMPTANMWIIEVAPETIRGKLVGKANRATFIAMFLSPILVQPIINRTSIAFSFAIVSLFALVLVALLFLLKSKQKTVLKTEVCPVHKKQ